MTDPTGSGPVRWGFLGAGGIARDALGPAVHAADGALLQAAGARDPERARGLRPAGAAYGSYDEVLADPDVEAVYIALANDAHRPWTIRALEAGKHVLCEKPLGLDVAEVDAMGAAAEEADRLLVEAFWYRWHPRVRRAQELLADGAIGRVRHVASGFTFDGVPADNYRLDPAMGGGALYDVGCYAVSAVLWAVGALPSDVVARSRLAPSGVDLATDAVLSWEDVTAEVACAVDDGRGQWLVITGDDGEIELGGESFTSRDSPSELLASDGRTSRSEPFGPVNPYQVMVEEMSSVLRGGPGWVHSLAESRAVAQVLADCRAAAGRAGGMAGSGQ